MTIDTTKLRENVAKEHIGLWVDPTGIILALCDELDQARADVLKLRDAVRDYRYQEPGIGERGRRVYLNTESYEQYR